MTRDEDTLQRFTDRYAIPYSEAALAVEREAIGANVGANGYTTLRQADLLADELRLDGGSLLLDVGAGRGWPALYLADKTFCRTILLDMPVTALRAALERIDRQRLADRTAVIRASGTDLPFRSATFDAVSHTDTL